MKQTPFRTRTQTFLAVGLLLLIGGSLCLTQAWRHQSARNRVAQALDNPYTLNDPSLRPQMQTPSLPPAADPESTENASPFNPFSGEAGVSVEETDSAYELTIPLASAEDADRVSLNITPYHIEVSGQTGTQSEGSSPGFSSTSSFMQSFDTRQEVLPDQVSRRMQQGRSGQLELRITIPKSGSARESTPDPGSRKSTGAQPFSLDDPDHPIF